MRTNTSAQLALCVVAGLTGSVFAQCPGAPTVDEDLGVLTPGVINRTVTLVGNDVHWFKFTLAAPVEMSALTFLNIDTNGTVGTSVDNELGVYDCAGNLMATDDDDSTGLMSALSFGSGNAVQQGDTTAVWSNGRDNRLAAGDYYIAIARYNATFGLTGFNVTTTATTGHTAALNIELGSTTALPDPAGTIDLGTLGASAIIQRTGDALGASQVLWYKVTIPAANTAAGTFIDMDTEGSLLSPTNATRISVYNVTGAITGTLSPTTKLNVTTGLTDTVDGTNSLSQISLGAGTRPAPGNGLAYNGRDGDLQAGTYLIAIAGPGVAPSGTSPTTGGNFGQTSTSTNAGTINFRIASAAPALTVTGNSVTAQELSTVLLTANVALGPGSTNPVVRCDLSSIGGSSNQLFYDDGTNGDVTAGDLVFSYSYALPNNAAAGVRSLPLTATDAQSNSANGAIALTITAGPSGACCVSANCSTTSQVGCNVLGGSFSGVGTSCGAPTYAASAGSTTFASIAATGTLLGTVSNCDDCSENVTLPFAAPFNFYGNSYTSVGVSSNGLVVFGGSSTTFTNAVIPTAAAPNNFAAAIWDDFRTDTVGDVYTFYDSVNNTFTISWEGVTQFGLATPDNNNFQVILYGNTNNIELVYGTITPETPAGDYSAGIEDSTGSAASVNAGTPVADTAVMITFTPGVNPCNTGPTCDTIDYNNDGLFPDTLDVDDFISVFGGGPCSNDPNCGDLDFNNDGLFPDTLDLDALISVFSGGPCL